jgi:hypothetical protein
MKQKIENLSFEAFKRWADKHRGDCISYDDWWKSLCAEAEKREPLICYLVEKDGQRYFFSSEFDAKQFGYVGASVIKLQEVNT